MGTGWWCREWKHSLCWEWQNGTGSCNPKSHHAIIQVLQLQFAFKKSEFLAKGGQGFQFPCWWMGERLCQVCVTTTKRSNCSLGKYNHFPPPGHSTKGKEKVKNECGNSGLIEWLVKKKMGNARLALCKWGHEDKPRNWGHFYLIKLTNSRRKGDC